MKKDTKAFLALVYLYLLVTGVLFISGLGDRNLMIATHFILLATTAISHHQDSIARARSEKLLKMLPKVVISDSEQLMLEIEDFYKKLGEEHEK